MPISINTTPDTVAWGPGVFFPWQSDIFGPFVQPMTITIELHTTPGEALVWRHEYTADMPSLTGGQRVFYDQNQSVLYVPRSISVPDNTDVILQVFARDGRGILIDQGQKTLPWQNNPQLHNQLQELPTVTGGFTATDRANLLTTVDQTQVQIQTGWPATPVLSNPLADWLNLSHGTLLRRGSVQILEGRGQIDFHPGGAGLALGGFFSWFRIPANLGRRDGLVPVYTYELLQLGIVYADQGSNLYYDGILGFRYDGVFVKWPPVNAPERVDYWVFPGVQVAWQNMQIGP